MAGFGRAAGAQFTVGHQAGDHSDDCSSEGAGPGGDTDFGSIGNTGPPVACRQATSGRRPPPRPRGLTGKVYVLRLMCVEIHESARRHQVGDEDIDHDYRHCLCWVEVGEDPTRYLLAGPDRAGNLLELVLLVGDDLELVIHAMALRESARQVLFGPGEPR
jgi:hypothetical protein